MKRLLFSVLALAALVACNKNEVLETVSPDAIAFEGAWVDNATRSEDPSYTNGINDKFELKEFEVYGFMNNVNGVVFDQELVSKSVVGGAAKWSYVNTQYWTPNRTYYFAALAPAGGYSLDKSTANEKGVGEVTFVQPKELNKVGTVDLIYSAAKVTTPNSTSYNETVKLDFHHLLSKVKFSFTNGFTNDNATVKITGIEMTVPSKGTINLADDNWWDNPADWVLEAGKTTTMKFGDMEVEKLKRGEKTSSAYERLTFPTVASQEYEVKFHAQLYYGTELAYESDLTTTITGAVLEMGRAYNFHAIINNENIAPGNETLKPIEFAVESINDWGADVEYDGGAIVTGPFVVSTSEELAAALEQINDPANKVQAATIEVPAGTALSLINVRSATGKPFVEVTNNLTFVLNGTLNAGVFAESNGQVTAGNSDSYVFWVKKGAELTIEGNGTANAQAADYSMAIWADGGKVNINGGTFINAGKGSDLVYASNGGSVYVNGGIFKAVKQDFDNYGEGNKNEYSALNLKDASNGDKAGKEIVVRGGKFYGFNPANNVSEGPATNFVAKGYMSVKSVENGMDVYTVVPADFNVGNKEEMQAAVMAAENAPEATITLTNDIDLVDEIVKVTKGNITFNLNGKTIKSTKDVFEVAGGQVTIEGNGNVIAAATNTEPWCAVWAYGSAKVIINGGTYAIGYPEGDYNDLIYAKEDATITINGGYFKNSGKDGAFVLNLKDGSKASIKAFGGSFEKFNPANNKSENPQREFVATGCNVVKTVVKDVAVYTVMNPANAMALTENVAAVTIFNVGTLDGNGKTLTIDEVERGQFLKDNTLRLIEAKAGATIKNLNIDGKNAKYGDPKDPYVIRGIYMVEAGTYTIDNVHFKDVTYTINDNSTAPKTFKISNSTFEGWTSYNPGTTVDFTAVNFKVNEDAYGAFRPYGNTTLTNCDFAEGFEFKFDKIGTNKITFKNCTYNGVAITAENIKDIWAAATNYEFAK